MDKTINSINWFEIPVENMDRAKKFYETIFNIEMPQMDMGGMLMAMFPSENTSGKVSGALVKGNGYKPSAEGAKVYLNGNPDLAIPLGKVEGAGGKVLMPKTKIGDDIGYMAFFVDSEGNSVAMHCSPEK